MAQPVTHFSKVKQFTWGGALVTKTGTLCNRFTGTGDINCTTDPAEVTCKLCSRELAAQTQRAA